MKHTHLINRLQESRIDAAIATAEMKTTAIIRVFISTKSHPNVLLAAERYFRNLGLDQSPDHNAVLIFVAPESQTFAIYGDVDAHTRVGPQFWNIVRDEMGSHLKEARFTDAIVHAIKKIGELLAKEFPRKTNR